MGACVFTSWQRDGPADGQGGEHCTGRGSCVVNDPAILVINTNGRKKSE